MARHLGVIARIDMREDVTRCQLQNQMAQLVSKIFEFLDSVTFAKLSKLDERKLIA